MAIRITKKEIKNRFPNRIYTGYCNLQHLFPESMRTYYTTRAEGWGNDIHMIDGDTVLITGYDAFGNIHVDYETAKMWDEKAAGLYKRCDYNYQEYTAALYELQQEFKKAFV